MKTFLFLLVTASYAIMTSAIAQQPFKSRMCTGKCIGIAFYRNIEFSGFAFFLGSMGPAFENDHTLMNNGVTKQEWFAYNFSLYNRYRNFKTSPALQRLVPVFERMGGSALIRLMLRL